MSNMEQIAKQCDAVAHLARCIAEVHAEKAEMFRENTHGAEHIADLVGRDTAFLMETLGNILNDMDAVTEDDAWIKEVFLEAQRLFPQD